MDEESINQQLVRRRQLHDRHVRSVVVLLERRRDLKGICSMADHVADSFAWLV